MAELLTIRRDIAEHIHFSDRSLAGVLTWTAQRLKVVDGSSINAPDTPENRAQYPQSEQQNPQCGFPLINLVGIFCLRTGALLAGLRPLTHERQRSFSPAPAQS